MIALSLKEPVAVDVTGETILEIRWIAVKNS